MNFLGEKISDEKFFFLRTKIHSVEHEVATRPIFNDQTLDGATVDVVCYCDVWLKHPHTHTEHMYRETRARSGP